ILWLKIEFLKKKMEDKKKSRTHIDTLAERIEDLKNTVATFDLNTTWKSAMEKFSVLLAQYRQIIKEIYEDKDRLTETELRNYTLYPKILKDRPEMRMCVSFFQY